MKWPEFSEGGCANNQPAFRRENLPLQFPVCTDLGQVLTMTIPHGLWRGVGLPISGSVHYRHGYRQRADRLVLFATTVVSVVEANLPRADGRPIRH
mgnify:CR=1 FL=1